MVKSATSHLFADQRQLECPPRGPTKKTKWLSSATEPAPFSEESKVQSDDPAEPAEVSLFIVRDK